MIPDLGIRGTRSILVPFLLLGLLLTGAVVVYPGPAREAEPEQTLPWVGLVRSQATFSAMGQAWVHEWQGAHQALRRLEVPFQILEDDDLEAPIPANLKLLILPQVRCVSRSGGDNLRGFVSGGGRILALGQAAYRDGQNHPVGPGNDFLLSDLYGVHFFRWTSGYPNCEGLRMVSGQNLPGLPSLVRLGRNTGMLVTPSGSGKVLAWWGHGPHGAIMESSAPGQAALVEGARGRVIYCGENLLAPENVSSSQVLRLVGQLMNRLVPGTVAKETLRRVRGLGLVLPEPEQPPPGAGPPVILGITSAPQDSLALAASRPWELRVTSLRDGRDLPWKPAGGGEWRLARPAGSLVKVRLVATGLKAPELVLYDWSGKLLGRGAMKVRGLSYDPRAIAAVVMLKDNGTMGRLIFRGTLEVSIRNRGLEVKCRTRLEDYLAGVVPNEVPPSFPPQALQAMAITARTFSVASRGRHGGGGFDLCTTVHCQVYGGAQSEDSRTNAALRATAGQVLRFGDHWADTTFHSTCGGRGCGVDEAWGRVPVPYLSPYWDALPPPQLDLSRETDLRRFIDSPPPAFCAGSSRFRWEEAYSVEVLESQINRALPVLLEPGSRVGKLRDLRVAGRSPSGRVQSLLIQGSRGKVTVQRDGIRWLTNGGIIGTGGLQSTLFYIEKRSRGGLEEFIFRGGGWGHGVGLCQEGAAGMALQGFNTPEILAHYYPGTVLDTIMDP